MEGGREFRELLAADAALMLGVAEAPDVAAALQRYWARRGEPGATFETEIRRIAGLGEDVLARIRTEVERLLGQAGGDAKAALTRHGGLDRSIHLALGKGGGDLSRALSVMGVSIRAPLRTLPLDRYVGFDAAGIGGMGIVYAALDTEMNRRVAFKMVRPHAERGREEPTPSTPLEATRPPRDTPESEVFEQLKARLVQEAWVTGGLEHPGIVPVYEIGQTPTGIPYYTMRYVRGERTLADALREKKGAAFGERLALLEPFLKVCDTLRYAHDKGVVHRDLKPANVALGQYGEVVLLDWGLARLEGREDVASSAWQEKVEELRRDADFHTMEGGALGTAGYMAPEAALGRLAEVDQRSDVYSLGAMLFEILAGRLPFQFRSFLEYASLLLQEAPPAAREVDRSVPEALSALCARALARGKDERPASAQDVADAVRAWQVQDAADREVEALLRDARSALESAEALHGDARLVQVDRAAAALAQVEAKRPGSAEAKGLAARAHASREQGIRERERASARRLLRRVAVGALAAAAVAAFVVVTIVEGKRQEAEDARAAAASALEAKSRALQEKSRALDEVARLSARITDLWLESTDPQAQLIQQARLAYKQGDASSMEQVLSAADPWRVVTSLAMLGDLELAERLARARPATRDTAALPAEVGRWRAWEGDRSQIVLLFDRIRSAEFAFNRGNWQDALAILDDLNLPARSPPSLRARFHGTRMLAAYYGGHPAQSVREGLAGIEAAREAGWWKRVVLLANPIGQHAILDMRDGVVASRIWNLALEAAEELGEGRADIKGYLGIAQLLQGNEAGVRLLQASIDEGSIDTLFTSVLSAIKESGSERAERLRVVVEASLDQFREDAAQGGR